MCHWETTHSPRHPAICPLSLSRCWFSIRSCVLHIGGWLLVIFGTGRSRLTGWFLQSHSHPFTTPAVLAHPTLPYISLVTCPMLCKCMVLAVVKYRLSVHLSWSCIVMKQILSPLIATLFWFSVTNCHHQIPMGSPSQGLNYSCGIGRI